ncbi:unnamed protein product [Caenorhabditis angaria]|uniref:Protein-tyrosine sulfotransferase n=1 Tax=Caenorhabditis angaria TaxID=860376 RepID=A0A9P1IJD7_9PELO|nr:unnamed protein product [Caenorhabditis angaria]
MKRCKILEIEIQNLKLSENLVVFEEQKQIPERESRKILSNDEPLIFVGGIPRSGTTLMRAILDAHPNVRCGGETMMIPNFLSWQASWRKSDWANNTGITRKVMDDAVSAFMMEIIAKHGEMADRLCNKDPYTALWLPTLQRLYPNSKFILMIRDARAIIHSMIERKVPVVGYNISDEKQMFRNWNTEIRKMTTQCMMAGGNCLKVYYERLIQRPKDEIERICQFLDIEFDERMLKHEEFIGVEVALSSQEFSASQVKNSINNEPLTSWFDCFDMELLSKLDRLAPFLKLLGYDTESDKPSYDYFASDDFFEFRSVYS